MLQSAIIGAELRNSSGRSSRMELIIAAIKYIFVVALGVEAILIGRAIMNLAREKARAAAQPSTARE
jgi:hypothetical protein